MAQQASELPLLDHLPLVWSIARRLRPHVPYVEVEDLVSAGTIGLIEAAARYDRTRGVAFASFAYRRVRGAMLDEARRQSRPSLGTSAETVTEQKLLSLETVVDEDATVKLMDVLMDAYAPAPETTAELQELLEAVAQLPQRERDMLALRAKGYTVGEIGRLHGCSDARASQLLAKARLRLEERLAA